MAFDFHNLTPEVRRAMTEEINADIPPKLLNMSRRFNAVGHRDYPAALLKAAHEGNEDTLAGAMRLGAMFAETETHIVNGQTRTRVVSQRAAETFAEGEFNRYYMRALCRVALSKGINEVQVYRARHSENPRPESEALIGKVIECSKLLADLRDNWDLSPSFGVPPGPNSGLSVFARGL